MEGEGLQNSRELQLPPEVADFISKEQKLVAEEMQNFADKETIDNEIGVIADSRKAEHHFLNWVQSNYNPEKILYPSSGSDQIPKLSFGEDRVVHTSLEQYQGDGSSYFTDLGQGNKVISSFSVDLPFGNSSFDTIVLLELESPLLQEDTNNRYKREINRVLKEDGLVILSLYLNPEEDADKMENYKQLASTTFPDLKMIDPPEETQYQGEFIDIKYYLLQK